MWVYVLCYVLFEILRLKILSIFRLLVITNLNSNYFLFHWEEHQKVVEYSQKTKIKIIKRKKFFTFINCCIITNKEFQYSKRSAVSCWIKINGWKLIGKKVEKFEYFFRFSFDTVTIDSNLNFVHSTHEQVKILFSSHSTLSIPGEWELVLK